MATVKVPLFSANRFIVRGFGQKATDVKLCAMYRGDLNKSLVRGGLVYLDGASVSANVNALLRKGPKFALVPRLPRHQVARYGSRHISEGACGREGKVPFRGTLTI
ncbi:hypothetical protein MTO96_043901 [Rhipicephalus appendiculatus]